MPWVGGDYAAVGSAEFEEVRKWVQDDKVGGLVISIGLPLSYAAKLNELQVRSRVPLLIASDMEKCGMAWSTISRFRPVPHGGVTSSLRDGLGATGSATSLQARHCSSASTRRSDPTWFSSPFCTSTPTR